jgi:protein subunit release factor A
MPHKDLEERLRVLHQRYIQLQAKLSDPDIIKDIDLYSKLSKRVQGVGTCLRGIQQIRKDKEGY